MDEKQRTTGGGAHMKALAGTFIAAAVLAGCASAPAKQASAPAAAVQDFDALQIVRIDTVGPDGQQVRARCGVKNDRGSSEILAPGVAEVLRSARPLEVLCFSQGFRIAMRSLESGGDVIGPAATGAVTTGAVGAVAALPLLAVPVFGPFMYAGAVGGAALLGGAVNAADKHSQGKIYSYPPTVLISMVPENAPAGSALQPAMATRPLTAIEPVPPTAPSALNQAPLAAATPMPLPGQPAAPVRMAAAATTIPLMPISHAVPAFPPEADQAGVKAGTVRAQLAIDGDGNVTAVRIVSATHERVFDRAVNESLGRWKFAPGAPDRKFDAEIEFRRQ
jgi:TonB family protein